MQTNIDHVGYHGRTSEELDSRSEEIIARFKVMPDMTRDEHAEQSFWNGYSQLKIETPDLTCTSFLASAIQRGRHVTKSILDEVQRREPELYQRDIVRMLG